MLEYSYFKLQTSAMTAALISSASSTLSISSSVAPRDRASFLSSLFFIVLSLARSASSAARL